jgi:hypothetical protein
MSFDPGSYKDAYRAWQEKFHKFDRETRDLLEPKEQTFDVNLKHFYLTGGKQITVPCLVTTGLKTTSSYDENWKLGVTRFRDYDPETNPVRNVCFQSRPTPEVILQFLLPGTFASSDYRVREGRTGRGNHRWFIDRTDLPSEEQAEYYRLGSAANKEPKGLSKALLEGAERLEIKRLNDLTTKCNVYLAHALWEQVIPKVFTPEQIKEYFLDSTTRCKTKQQFYMLLCERSHIVERVGAGLYE